MVPWSISIKSVGGDGCSNGNATVAASSTASTLSPSRHLTGSSSPSIKSKEPSDVGSGSLGKEASKPVPSLFTVQVDSEAPLCELSESIEAVTGLKSYQQRLIYRGRILSIPEPDPKEKWVRFASRANDNAVTSSDPNAEDEAASLPDQTTLGDESSKAPRICDIQGLDDGHTIHLVPKRNAKKPSILNGASPSTTASTSNDDDGGEDDDDQSGSSSMASSLLSAILGLGVGGPGNGTGWSTMTDGGVTIVAGPAGGDDDEDLTTLGGLSALIGRASDPTRGAGTTTARRVSNLRANRAQRRAANMAAARYLSSDNNDNNNSSTGNQTGSSSSSGSQRQSSSTSANGSSSVPHRRQRGYRDGVPPLRDAGSLEPVRQGIMTLNTVLGAHRDAQEAGVAATVPGKGNADHNYPVTADTTSKRTFYKGQWIDVKDTVNQWLEATVLDIVTPSDVLGKDEFDHFVQQDLNDTIFNEEERKEMLEKLPVVSATDLDGRRQLLIKSTPVSALDIIAAAVMNASSTASPSSPIITTMASAMSPAGLNDSVDTSTTPPPPPPVESLLPCTSSDVQLLKVHYNGWPHRWDEWIRSDSHRIRPFRTRTRHSSSVPYASPNIHSSYDDSPPTYIRCPNDEALEREAVIPELSAVVSQANQYVKRVADGLPIVEHLREKEESQKEKNAADVESNSDGTATATETDDVTMEGNGIGRNASDASDEEETEEGKEPEPDGALYPRDEKLLPWGRTQHTTDENFTTNDFGRELTASPLKASNDDTPSNVNDVSFASSVGGHTTSNRRRTTREDLQGLASLLDRLGRTLTDMAPHVASLAASLPEEVPSHDEKEKANDVIVADGDDSKPSSTDEITETVTPITGHAISSPNETEVHTSSTVETDHSSEFALLELLNSAQASSSSASAVPSESSERPATPAIEGNVTAILSGTAPSSAVSEGTVFPSASLDRSIPNPISNSDPSMPLLVSLRDTAESIAAMATTAAATTSPGAATSHSLTMQQQRHRRQSGGLSGNDQPNESIDFINGMVHARSPNAASGAPGGGSSTSTSSSASRSGNGSSSTSSSDRTSSRARSREALVSSLLSSGPRQSIRRAAVASGRNGSSDNNTGDNNNGNDSDNNERGSGSTGRTASIDVHFHTVITPPGFGAGGIVFGGMGPGAAAGFAGLLDEVELSRASPSNNGNSNNNSSSSPSNVALNPPPIVRRDDSNGDGSNNSNDDDDDMGLFDGLYGESNNNDSEVDEDFGRLRDMFLAVVEEVTGVREASDPESNTTSRNTTSDRISGSTSTTDEDNTDLSSGNNAGSRAAAETEEDEDNSPPPLLDQHENEPPSSDNGNDDNESENEGNVDNENTNDADDDDSLPPLLDPNEVNAQYSSSSSEEEDDDDDDDHAMGDDDLQQFVLDAVNAVRADNVIPMLLEAGAELVVDLEGDDSSNSDSNNSNTADADREANEIHSGANQYVRPDTVVLDRSDEDDDDDDLDSLPPLVDFDRGSTSAPASSAASDTNTPSSEMEISDDESTSGERRATKSQNSADATTEDSGIETAKGTNDSSSNEESENLPNTSLNEIDSDDEGRGLFGGVLRRFGL